MKTRILVLLAGLALAAALGLTGCSEERAAAPTGAEPTVTDDYATLDFDAEYGGLTATDEPVAFADPALERMLAEEALEEVVDPLATDPEVLALEALAETAPDSLHPILPRFTFLRMTWGMLDTARDSLGEDAEGPETLDWSGMVQVDRGIVVVRRVIRFEWPRDRIILPRPDRQTVEWVSHTGLHYDGLLVEIIEPPVFPDSTGALPPPNQLRFVTPPFTHTFLVDELGGLKETFPVQPEGNAIEFTGFQVVPAAACPQGFMDGFWQAHGDSTGEIMGRWMGQHGRIEGFVRAGYGQSSDGERVLVGKWISRHGEFRGLLRGSWDTLPQPGTGRFEGHWVNEDGSLDGRFGGEFVWLPGRAGGFFGGRWAALCDDGQTE